MLRFREILAEVDEDFTETELDDIIAEVRKFHLIYQNQPISSTVSPVSLEFPCIDWTIWFWFTRSNYLIDLLLLIYPFLLRHKKHLVDLKSHLIDLKNHLIDLKNHLVHLKKSPFAPEKSPGWCWRLWHDRLWGVCQDHELIITKELTFIHVLHCYIHTFIYYNGHASDHYQLLVILTKLSFNAGWKKKVKTYL